MHHRRYSLRNATNAFRSVGFRVEDESHLGFFAYPPFSFVKRRNRRYLAEPPEVQRAIVARDIRQTSGSVAMKVVMNIEGALGRFVRYPVGIRCVFVAVKA
jgi:hypothetical protein